MNDTMESAMSTTCDLHLQEPLSNFCKTCDHPICDSCMLYDHVSHKTTKLGKMAKKIRKRISKQVEEIQETYVAPLTENLEQLQKTKKLRKEEISEKGNNSDLKIEELETLESTIKKDLKVLEEMISDFNNLESSGSDLELITTSKQAKYKLSQIRTTISKRNKSRDIGDDTTSDENVNKKEKADEISMSVVAMTSQVAKMGIQESEPNPQATLNSPKISEQMLHVHVTPKVVQATEQKGASPQKMSPGPTRASETVNSSGISICDIASINHGSNTVGIIIPVSENEAWVHCSQTKQNELINTKGEVLQTRKLGSNTKGFVITTEGNQIFGVYRDKRIKKISTRDEIIDLFDTSPLHPTGVCNSQDGGIFVCLIDQNSFQTDENSRRIIKHFSLSNRGSKIYEFMEDGNTRLFNLPVRVYQNHNSDICVVDLINNHRSQLCALDTNGRLKFKYSGQQFARPFFPGGICFDTKCRILVTDCNNHRVHILSPEGQFLQCLPPLADSLQYPFSIALHSNKLWLGSDGKIRVFTYKYD